MKKLLLTAFNLLTRTLVTTCIGQNFTPYVRNFITDSASTIAFIDVKIIDGTGSASKIHQTLIRKNGRILRVQ